MMLDFSGNGTILDEVIVAPDWNFSDIPTAAADIKEIISIGGSSTTTVSIGGEIDDRST